MEIGEGGVLCPCQAAIFGDEQLSGLRARVEPAMGMMQRPDGMQGILERGRAVLPPDHGCELWVARGPLVHLAGRQLREVPGLPAVGEAPDARAVPELPPAQIIPVAGSPVMWLIGQPPQ